MQGQRPRPPWTFVEQLRQRYEVASVATDVNEIKDVDILLVMHPKDLSDQTLFAIDQFVLKGGRTIVCVDPHCFTDEQERRELQMGAPSKPGSDLNRLLRTWGLEMPENTFAGDRGLALSTSITPNARPEKIIGFLNLSPPDCFNSENVITAELNQVRFLFPGVLKQVSDPNKDQAEDIRRTPIITTTSAGNSWSISSPFELAMLEPSRLMDKFVDGTEPVAMAYRVTGKFTTSFPEGIEIEVQVPDDESAEDPEESSDEKKTKKIKKRITGLTESAEDCVVVVFADVDFISDTLAYRDFFFGKVVVGDNSTLMLNAIDDLQGSSDLISVRSRGSFRRSFVVIEEIEKQAEAETAEEEARINAEIAGFQNELSSIVSSAQEGQQEVIGSSILQKKQDLELKIHQAKRRLREVKMQRRERIEHLGNMLRNFNMLMAPAVILVIAIVLGIHRSARKRHYISHASDA
ncbi:MAG: Gldg family protein, partial [Planctomycetota bacterium]